MSIVLPRGRRQRAQRDAGTAPGTGQREAFPRTQSSSTTTDLAALLAWTHCLSVPLCHPVTDWASISITSRRPLLAERAVLLSASPSTRRPPPLPLTPPCSRYRIPTAILRASLLTLPCSTQAASLAPRLLPGCRVSGSGSGYSKPPPSPGASPSYSGTLPSCFQQLDSPVSIYNPHFPSAPSLKWSCRRQQLRSHH